MKPGQAYALGYQSGAGRRVNAGCEALIIYAYADEDECQSYARGVRDGQVQREQEARAAEAAGGNNRCRSVPL